MGCDYYLKESVLVKTDTIVHRIVIDKIVEKVYDIFGETYTVNDDSDPELIYSNKKWYNTEKIYIPEIKEIIKDYLLNFEDVLEINKVEFYVDR